MLAGWLVHLVHAASDKPRPLVTTCCVYPSLFPRDKRGTKQEVVSIVSLIDLLQLTLLGLWLATRSCLQYVRAICKQTALPLRTSKGVSSECV